MQDLIYGNSEIYNLIKEKYPDATYEDASDFIHQERFEVEFDKDKKDISDEYIEFAIKEGFACYSLKLQMMFMMKKEIPRIKQIIDNIKDAR